MAKVGVKAIVISTGNELVLGQSVDTNTAWLSDELTRLGITVVEHITVGDELESIAESLSRAGKSADVILVSGGLGPTEDDLTRNALAKVLGAKLQLHERALAGIESFFAGRGWQMVETNRVQAMIPSGCDIIGNAIGTAPGITARIGKAAAFFMPGVPSEMKKMFSDSVRPGLEKLARENCDGIIVRRSLHTFGIGESRVALVLGDIMARGRNPLVNCTVSAGVISISINAHGENEAAANNLSEATEKQIREKLGEYIFGCNGESLAEAAGRELLRKKMTIAVAESCTGGLLGGELTRISGASEYFKCGWICYSNQSKIDKLDVNPKSMAKFGAVSEQVAGEMATGARWQAEVDIALSITGIAGPTGGTADKPTGLVYIGLANEKETTVKRNLFHGDRDFVRKLSVNTALSMLIKALA